MIEIKDLSTYLNKLNPTAQKIYFQLKSIINKIDQDVCETIFVSHPYYYIKKHETIKPHYRPSLMTFYFKDHVDIFSTKVKAYEKELDIYKITPKYTLQIYYDQNISEEVLLPFFKVSID